MGGGTGEGKDGREVNSHHIPSPSAVFPAIETRGEGRGERGGEGRGGEGRGERGGEGRKGGERMDI